jgi:DnaJ-domain-containing protein 1
MQRKHHDFPEERDTDTDLMPSARPPPSPSDPPESRGAPSGTWRPRPPTSTTYTIVPAREDAKGETIFTPPPLPRSSRPPSKPPWIDGARSEPPLRGYDARMYESGEVPAGRNAMLPPLDEDDADLTPRQRTWIDQLYGALDAMTHYELLGITDVADRDAVRQAYFARVATYHPDRFFGKRIGLFARKVQAIFSRINDAYAALRDPETRAAYDAWLASTRKAAAKP